jgi:hypothetical protein
MKPPPFPTIDMMPYIGLTSIYYTAPIAATMLEVGTCLSSIQEAWEAINRHVLDGGEPYNVYKLDSKRHILQRKHKKDDNCSFCTRAAFQKKKGVIITKISPHLRRPTFYFKNKQASAV